MFIHEYIEFRNALSYAKSDIVLNFRDNAGARYFGNDACVSTQTTLIHDSTLGTDGTLTVLCGGALSID